uniref:Transcriptional coactivator p15 (PC4) C-terminal domain-containing protein n=1 Tax=Cuerna arida TaxID=1464854 RepID=A0A1B6F020_9HEMI
MPKDKAQKKRKDDSDSDSGPEDRGPDTKKLKKDKDDIDSFHIEGMKYLKVRTFKGKVLIDIREYYESNGDIRPGKKGISLSAAQWKKVVGLVDQVEDALKKV